MPLRSALRRILALPLWPLVAGYLLLSDVVGPALRPAMRALGRLRSLKGLRAWLGTLRPYAALVILGVPAAAIEVLKLLAVYWAARGHPVSGAAMLLALHGASLLSTERLFAVVKPQLLTIPWFAALWGRIEGVRDALQRWLRGTRAWVLLRRLRRATGRAAARVRAAFRHVAGGPR